MIPTARAGPNPAGRLACSERPLVRNSAFLPVILIINLIACAEATARQEYGKPGPQIIPPKGGFINRENYKGIKSRSYLEYKSLLIKPDGIYYVGRMRVHGTDGAPGDVLIWRFEARCAARPDLADRLKPELSYGSKDGVGYEGTIEINPSAEYPPLGLEIGWYQLWSYVCRERLFKF
jgi:hypothetical protein